MEKVSNALVLLTISRQGPSRTTCLRYSSSSSERNVAMKSDEDSGVLIPAREPLAKPHFACQLRLRPNLQTAGRKLSRDIDFRRQFPCAEHKIRIERERQQHVQNSSSLVLRGERPSRRGKLPRHTPTRAILTLYSSQMSQRVQFSHENSTCTSSRTA